ncbi:MAG: hypothetical protein QGI13_16630, partial [Rhodospirillales bacterium]|nr:hypothetical protein [Rhodospirillales bacterium]
MSPNHSPDRARILGPVLAVVAALGLGADAATLPMIGEDQLASIVRGGRLYDNWYTETMSPPPATRH